MSHSKVEIDKTQFLERNVSHHFEHADQELDPHSPRHKGFWWAHIGWVMQRKLDETRFDKIKDFAASYRVKETDQDIIFEGFLN